MSTTAFWRRPVWILGHLIALVAVVAFVRAGLWQLDRLDQKQARNRMIATRADGPAVPLVEIDLDEARYQRARASGHFDADATVTIRNRSYRGANGLHVVTPFVYADGRAVAVNRGWIGADDDVPPPPDGVVTIEGVLLPSQERGSFGPRDPDGERLATLSRLDVDRLQQQYVGRLLPLYLQLTSPLPPDGELPLPLAPPARDDGPHLSYAIQWFLFAAVVAVGYPILLRRRASDARSEQGETAVDGEDLTGDVAGVVGQEEHHR